MVELPPLISENCVGSGYSYLESWRLAICPFTWFSNLRFLLLWACLNIIFFEVRLILRGDWLWLIVFWYYLRLHATQYFIFNQNVQISAPVLVTIFVMSEKVLFSNWESTNGKLCIKRHSLVLTKKPSKSAESSSSCHHRRNTGLEIREVVSRFRFCHLLAIGFFVKSPSFPL